MEIADTHTRLVIDTVQLLWNEGIRFDGVFLIGDFASTNGMLISPEMCRRMVFSC